MLWRDRNLSPFKAFSEFTDWLYAKVGRTDSIALARLAELLFEYLTGPAALNRRAVAETLARDWQRAGRRDIPEFLRADVTALARRPTGRRSRGARRQSRHWVIDRIDFPQAAS
jgi:hypothetical protein